MTSITANDVEIALGSGTTWGTAASVTGTELVRASALSIQATRNNVDQEDIGAGNFRNQAAQTTETVNVSVTCDFSAGPNGWKRILAHFFGASTASPTENNVGQGDYLHNIDMVSTPTNYNTLVYLVETDKVIEIPSVIWTSAQVQINAANKGSITFSGIGDRIVKDADATNSDTDVTGLSYPTDYEILTLDGANAYARVGDYSTSTALTGSDDFEATSFSMTLNRPYTTSFALRGANTKFTKLPRHTGYVTGTVSLGLYELDDAILDVAALFQDGTYQMAELFVDGAQLGTGDNTSVRIQMPYLLIDSLPETGFSGNQDARQPTITFSMYDPTAEASGMSGVTMCRVAAVDNKSGTFLA